MPDKVWFVHTAPNPMFLSSHMILASLVIAVFLLLMADPLVSPADKVTKVGYLVFRCS